MEQETQEILEKHSDRISAGEQIEKSWTTATRDRETSRLLDPSRTSMSLYQIRMEGWKALTGEGAFCG